MSCCNRSRAPVSAAHALDPVTAAEIEAATAALRARVETGPRTWVETVVLAEPDFEALDRGEDGPETRVIYICAWDPDARLLWRGEYSPSASQWHRFESLPGVFPRITGDEFAALGEKVAHDPVFVAALAGRGIHDPDLVLVEPWDTGHFDEAEGRSGRRLVYTHCWAREHLTDNAYARPVAGLHALVDADTGEILRLDDNPRAPLAPGNGNFRPAAGAPPHDTLKPLDIVQPEGPSFTVDGHRLRWDKWSFRVGFGVREGLILWDIRYRDGKRERPVLRRASMAEMVVPYFSPEPGDFRRNAFDCGEYGIGQYADSLALGCDCLGQIHYFDMIVQDWQGRPRLIEQAVCLHEEDTGVLAKHSDDWHPRAHVQRAPAGHLLHHHRRQLRLRHLLVPAHWCCGTS